MKVAVAGGGAFGLALAQVLSETGPVSLFARDADAVRRLEETRTSDRLPGVALSTDIAASTDAGVLAEADAVLLAVPAQALSQFLTDHRAVLEGRWLIVCAKGIDLATLKSPTDLIAEIMPGATAAVLSGPSFARDIAAGLPTALVLATAEGGEDVQAALSTSTLRLYLSHDLAGVQIGGAMKNVIAIACGAAMGAGQGESARAALMTRGFAEMVRLAQALGAQAETLGGLSGLGDLALTAMSDGSRNYRFGLALGRGAAWNAATTTEGAATARAAVDLARRHGLDLPVTAQVAELVDGRTDAAGALRSLLDRPLKKEMR